MLIRTLVGKASFHIYFDRKLSLLPEMNAAVLEVTHSVLLLYEHLTVICMACLLRGYLLCEEVKSRLLWAKHVPLVATDCLSQGYLL